MKITALSAFVLGRELERPFAFSQWKFTRRETVLVSVETDAGICGWGEAYGPPHPIAAAVREFFTAFLLGRDPRDTEVLWDFLFARSLDYGQKGSLVAAISALDIAFWDIKARSVGMPLYRLLGGSETESIPCYATGFYFEDQEPLESWFEREAEEYRRAGFGAVKMKVGRGLEQDVHAVSVLRRLIGPEMRLMIDANHAYDPATAIALGRRVERHNIFWFEEPVSPLNVEGYLQVKRSTGIPLAGGECESTRFGFETLLRARAVDYAQPDLCSCGGISEGMKIATLASLYDVHVTPHAWGSAIGQAAALHFYAARPRHPSTTTVEDKLIECDQTENPFRTQIVQEPIRFHQGRWLLPSAPGLGLEIAPSALQRFVVG